MIAILSQYKLSKDKINNNLDEIQRLRSCMEKVTVTYKDAPGWELDTSDQAIILTEIGKLSDFLKEEAAGLQDKNIKVQRLIDCLDDSKEREVLRHIYINGYTRGEMEEKLGYSRVQIYRIHKKAIRNILRKWETVGKR